MIISMWLIYMTLNVHFFMSIEAIFHLKFFYKFFFRTKDIYCAKVNELGESRHVWRILIFDGIGSYWHSLGVLLCSFGLVPCNGFPFTESVSHCSRVPLCSSVSQAQHGKVLKFYYELTRKHFKRVLKFSVYLHISHVFQ